MCSEPLCAFLDLLKKELFYKALIYISIYLIYIYIYLTCHGVCLGALICPRAIRTFPLPLWKRFRKTGILERFPERFFSHKTEISGTNRYGIPERSGISFRKFSGKSFRKFSGKSFQKFPVSGTIGTIITLKYYICKYNTS